MGLVFNQLCIFSQTADCSVNYERALLLYNSGMADSSLSVMKPCLDNDEALNKISKETRARIFRLASLSCIMKGDPEEAEKYARKMLINQPDYKDQQNEGDLDEFRLILDKIFPQPAMRIGISCRRQYAFCKT